MSFTPAQWVLGSLAALLVGFAKTGAPGVGIPAVPLLAAAFGGRPSVGVMLPMLILADCFAVAWYRQEARWDTLRALTPWVVIGVGLGTALLWALGEQKGQKDTLNLLIGLMVLVMLGVHLLRMRWGDRLTPHSRLAVVSVGSAAGFSTTVSNAGGPIMSIYLASIGLPKEQFMGTSAWYFFIFNSAKLPIYLVLTWLAPDKPILTVSSLRFDLAMLPIILLGVFTGRWFLPRVPQRLFDGLVLVLATVGAVKLIVG